MNRKILIKLLVCVVAFIFGASYFVTAAAATTDDDSITLSDLKKIVVLKDDDLFNNMKELVPGDTASNDVTITNNSDQEVTFYMYAEVKESHKNLPMVNKDYSSSLLGLLQLQLTMSNDVFYLGPVSGNPADAKSGQNVKGSLVLDKAKSQYGITLCKLPAKSSTTLKIELMAPGQELDNDFASTFTAVDWVFACYGADKKDEVAVKPVKNPKKPVTPTAKPTTTNTNYNPSTDTTSNNTDTTTSTYPGSLPKTGSVVSYLAQALGLLGVLVIGLCVIDYMRRKRINR